MELRIDINGRVVEWLASMGYPVSGMPIQLLHGMLLREARQWQVSPERLETMILEGAGHSKVGPAELGALPGEALQAAHSRERIASMPH